ncbi:MAG: LysM domain-containing protein [Acidimicrobiales bacterium]|nr:LysM domain-containing protein [Acidimicrobiales bacterium]
MTSHRLLAVLRLAAWTAGLVLLGRLLLAAGAETLAVPVTSLDDLSVWVSDTPPDDMVIAMLRLAALAAVAYLLAATALAAVAGVVRVRPLVAAADMLSPAIVRRLATGGSGLGLVLGGAVAGLPTPELPFGPTGDPVALTAPPAGPDRAPAAPTATMMRMPAATATMTPVGAGGASAQPIDGSAATDLASPPSAAPADPAADTDTDPAADADADADADATMIRLDEPAPPSATMTRLPDLGATAPVTATPAAHAPGPLAAPSTPAALAVDPTAWVVEPGDSLWSIAEEVVAPTDGTSPAERTVTRYWQRLVAANRANLVDPGNPDLLVPGQQLVLPANDA